jgi:phage repressor protein C with HTH and peptisase S24 domain
MFEYPPCQTVFDSRTVFRVEPNEIIPRLKVLGAKTAQVDAALKRSHPAGSNLLAGKRTMKADEIPALLKLIRELEATAQADPEVVSSYVPIEILPTYAGAGGGGTGDGAVSTALISRHLIYEELRGKPSDFVLVDIRGDSMEPDFFHGDQILCDKRDKSTAQPGPFALWDGDWGEYVIKNVERADEGQHRIFSTNPKYTPKMVAHEETRIIGRPVWLGRRL